MAWTTTAVRGADGKLRHAVTIGLDVTEQRAAEERARRAHGALEADRRALLRARRDLVDFAAAASHDLRGPLSDVAAAIAEIDHDSDAAPAHFEGHARRPAVVQARAALARANGVLDAMGDFERLGAGEAIARAVDVERTVDGVLRDLAADIAARGADVTRGPLPTLAGDPAELRTLIERLVGRALHTAGGAAPRVHVDAARRGQAWELCVADVGAGRVAGDERAPGLDLALCRRIAERHGGGLTVDADAAVRVTLPDRGAR